MMDTDILDMLEDIGRSATARLSPAVRLPGSTAEERRQSVLKKIRGTILPRRLEFTASNGDQLALEVSSSRVTDVFLTPSGDAPDFETEPRNGVADKLAQGISAISGAPAPLEVVSLRPDATPEADDVGITLSEIESACALIDLPSEPHVKVVAEALEPLAESEPVSEVAPEPDTEASSSSRNFFDGAERFALGRILVETGDATSVQTADLCAENAPLHPEQDVLARFVSDLSGWDTDSNSVMPHPQLIVMRPSGGRAAGIAVLRDGSSTAVAIHEARKLGAVVNLWKSIREAE